MISAKNILLRIVQSPFWIASSQLRRRNSSSSGRPPLFLFGFSKWKTFVADWFPDNEIIFVPTRTREFDFNLKWKWRILADTRARVMAWQYKSIPALKDFCSKHAIQFQYVEDGFLRSVALGALHTAPISLTFDTQDMYFNANAPSDLELLLSTFDFEAHPELTARAGALIRTLVTARLSKYNSGLKVDIGSIYGAKTRKRILVVGQVERDASIRYGCNRKIMNNDLVWLARRENPDAQIVYKPHPEVLQRTAEPLSDPDLVRDTALVLEEDISLADAFESVDHVYTITSLSGFEALMRGIPVTTVGCPFYSGWGITDDRQPNPRRGRKLTLEQVFAAAYILYPQYLDPVTKQRIEIEEAISILRTMRDSAPAPVPN